MAIQTSRQPTGIVHFAIFLKIYFIIFFNIIYFTSLREQNEAYINSSRWSMLVGLEPAHPHVSRRCCYLAWIGNDPGNDVSF